MKIKVLFFLIFFLPFVIVSFYNQPAIDDYWSANTIIKYGRLGASEFYFETASARFFSNFLMSMFNTLPAGQVWIFKAWPIVTMLMLLGSLMFFYTSLAGSITSSKKLLLASLLFVALHLANIRVLFDGLYWMSSTICYQVAICLFATGIGSLIRYIKGQSLAYGFVAVSCSVLLPGAVEFFSPIFIFVLASILYISVKQKYPLRFTFFCLAAALISLTIIVLSRGSHERIQHKSLLPNKDMLYALFYSIRAVAYYCVLWLTTPINFAALILLLPSFNNIVIQASSEASLFLQKPLALIPLFFFLCVLIYLPQIYFEAPVPFPRVTTLVFFVAFHLLLIFLGSALRIYPRFSRFVSFYSTSKNFHLYAWILFFVTALTTTNYTIVMKDLVSGNAYNFNLEANQRDKIIRQAKGDTCYVTLYDHWPLFNRFSKVQHISQHLDEYYGKTILYKKELSQ